jgi:hypothetical protein
MPRKATAIRVASHLLGCIDVLVHGMKTARACHGEEATACQRL